jgi:hypothetical protein
MEPTDLNIPPADDDRLAVWYRANLGAAPLADDGFCQRVLAALPVPTRRAAVIRRQFCLGGALVGIAVALVGLLSQPTLPHDLSALEPDLTQALAQLAQPAVGLACGITILSLWFVYRPEVRLLPRM